MYTYVCIHMHIYSHVFELIFIDFDEFQWMIMNYDGLSDTCRYVNISMYPYIKKA